MTSNNGIVRMNGQTTIYQVKAMDGQIRGQTKITQSQGGNTGKPPPTVFLTGTPATRPPVQKDK